MSDDLSAFFEAMHNNAQLGVVIGFVISYRTMSGYVGSRFSEMISVVNSFCSGTTDIGKVVLHGPTSCVLHAPSVVSCGTTSLFV